VPSERVFSLAGRVLTDRRSMLSGKRLEMLVVCKKTSRCGENKSNRQVLDHLFWQKDNSTCNSRVAAECMFVPNPNSPLIRPDPIQSDPIRSDRVSTRSDPIRIPPPRSGG